MDNDNIPLPRGATEHRSGRGKDYYVHGDSPEYDPPIPRGATEKRSAKKRGEDAYPSFDIGEFPSGGSPSTEATKEFGRGVALPVLGLVQSVAGKLPFTQDPYGVARHQATDYIKKIKETPEMDIPGLINPRTAGTLTAEGALLASPIKGVSGLGRASSVGGKLLYKTLGGAATGAATQYATTPVSSLDNIEKDKLEAAKSGAWWGGLLAGGGSLVGDVGKYGVQSVATRIKQAFGGDTKRAVEALKRMATNRSGKEADAALDLAKKLSVKSKGAERGAAKEAAKIEPAYSELKGVTLQQEAGRIKPIPESKEKIGTTIREYTDRFYDYLKKTRSAAADKNKGAAFDFAKEKELSGKRITDTTAYRSMQENMQRALVDIETGLANTPPGPIKEQLLGVKRALEGAYVDPNTGVVIGRPLSFEGLEVLRRMVKDRADGLPSVGFDAIGQQQAGKLAKGIESVMSEFSPKFKTFLDQYKRDSEPLRVFQSRLGKVLTERQPGTGGIVKVSAEDIPSRVFKNKENYQSLVDSVGGNKAFAESQAKRHFVNEMERLSGDPKKIEAFISANRDMLKLTNSSGMVEGYLRNIKEATKRGESLAVSSKNAREISEKQIKVADDFSKLQKQMNASTNKTEIVGLYKNFANELRKNGLIDDQKYGQMLSEADKTATFIKSTSEARKRLGYGAASAAAMIGGYKAYRGITAIF